jgi:hypothetical protein
MPQIRQPLSRPADAAPHLLRSLFLTPHLQRQEVLVATTPLYMLYGSQHQSFQLLTSPAPQLVSAPVVSR